MVARAVVSFLILAVVWSFGIPGRVDVGPEQPADAMGLPDALEAATPGRALEIDPGPHRAAIEPIEGVLYRRGPTRPGDAEAVERAAARLAHALPDALLGAGGRRSRQAGLELMSFAARTSARGDSGYGPPSLVALRGDWESVRARVFARVAWMREASADLDRIQEPPPPPLDPRADAVIAEAEETLRQLMLRGRREAELLGEPRYDPEIEGGAGRVQIQAWVRFGERYRRQLDRAMAPVERLDPAPRPGREPLRVEAVRALGDAYELLRRVPDGAGMWPTPFQPAWEARFQAANVALARARDQMAQATGTGDEQGDRVH